MSKVLQLFRNSTLYDNRTDALAGLKAKLEFAHDGEPILARYKEEGQVITILGIAGTPGVDNAAGNYTIFDTKGAAADLADAVAKIMGVPSTATDEEKAAFLNDTIWELDQTLKTEITARENADKAIKGNLETGDYETIKALSDALKEGVAKAKTVVNAKEDGHVTVTVTEDATDHHSIITVAENDIASAALLGTISDTEDNTTAFGYIAKEADRAATAEGSLADRLDVIEGEATVNGSIKKALADAKAYTDTEIQKLDSSVAAEDGKFITAVGIEDGKITSNTKGNLSSTNKTITINKFDIDVNVDGTTIVKDDETGVLSVASSALTQYVGENAINVSDVDASNNKTISLKVADTSLLQDTAGVKANITLKKIASPTDNTLAAQYQLVIPAVGETEEQVLGATIDIAKDQHLKDAVLGKYPDNYEVEAKRGHDALILTWYVANGSEQEIYIDVNDFLREAEFKNGLEVNNNGEVSVKIATDAETAKYMEFSGTEEGKKAIALKGISDAVAKATTEVQKTDGKTHVTVTSSEGTNSQKVYTIAESDIASATDLTNEIANRKAVDGVDGDSYVAKSDANYIKNADSLFAADVALDAQAKANADAIAQEVTDRQDAISGLNMTTVTAADGEYISEVSETAGKVGAQKGQFATDIADNYGTDEGKVAPTAKAVRTAIDAAAAKATTVVTGETAASGPAVKVTVKTPAADDGHVEYVVAGQDLASATLLATVNGADTLEGSFRKAVKDAKEAIISTASTDYDTLKKIEDKLSALEGSAVKTIKVNDVQATVSNNAATVTIDGADIKLDGYAKAAADAAIAATDTVNAALGKLEYGMDNTLEGVAQGNGINVTIKANQSQTITAVAATNDPIIEVTTAGIATKADAVWDCGYYD